jgi:hypothetical protein
MSKYVGRVIIADPTSVQARLPAGQIYHKGAVFCTIPEVGYLGQNLVYCRYGLSIPYVRVQQDWNLWVEPATDELMQERWVYTGLADCTGDSLVSPDTQSQLIFQLADLFVYIDASNKIYFTSKTADENFVKGKTAKEQLDKCQDLWETLKTAFQNWTPVPYDGGAALKTQLATFLTKTTPNYSQILSQKIYGK